MKTTKECSCKGIRTCAICSNIYQKDDENALYYFYCPTCNACYRSQVELNHQSHENIDTFALNGIKIVDNFISNEEEDYLVTEMNKIKWIDSQSGRLKQDYGPKVNFKKKKLKLDMFTGLPNYSKFLIERLKTIESLSNFDCVELCNLKYTIERGASIDPHFDDFWLWGPRLITLNLMEDTYLTMIPSQELNLGFIQILIPLKRLSLVTLDDDARYKWMHAIKRHHIKGSRIAMTFRELSGEFDDSEEGNYLKEKAMSFNGKSVGEIEDEKKSLIY